MEAADKSVEHRRAARRSSYMQASIFHPLQTEHLSCVVRDISQDGALIDFQHPTALPSLFWLRLDGEATLRLCTVAWRSVDQLGVEFSEQIMERRRVERWAQSHLSWSKISIQRKGHTPGPGIANPVKWSASLVCLRG